MSDAVQAEHRDDAVPASAGKPDAGLPRFVGHAVLVGVLTLSSRVTGLVRDAVLAAALGLSGVADAFFIGFLVPNLFRRLFGEGALSAAFIPHYGELLKDDPVLARRFASFCLAMLLVVLALITLAGEAVLAALLAGSWGGDTVLAIRLTMIMLPYMPLVCVVALMGGMLQVHRRFGAPAAVPVILNLVMIAVTVWAAWGGGGVVWGGGRSPHRIVTVVALSVLLAGVLQVLWQVLALRRCAPLAFDFAGTRSAVRSMVVMMVPMLIGLAVFQINVFLDSLIAFGFSAKESGDDLKLLFGYSVQHPIQAGGVAALQWSQRLYQFPLGVFGIAVSTAIFPALVHAATPGTTERADAFGSILRQGLRLTMFIGLPATVGLLIVRIPLVRVVFEHGAFESDDTQRVAMILAGYASGIWAYSLAHVLTRAFYARKDATTPLKISLAMVGLNLLLNLTLIWWLGAAGLAWSTAICAVGQVSGLLLAVCSFAGPVVLDRSVCWSWARSAGLTVMMAAALWPVSSTFDVPDLSPARSVALLVILVLGGMIIFLGGAWLMRAEELRWLWRRRTSRGDEDGPVSAPPR